MVRELGSIRDWAMRRNGMGAAVGRRQAMGMVAGDNLMAGP